MLPPLVKPPDARFNCNEEVLDPVIIPKLTSPGKSISTQLGSVVKVCPFKLKVQVLKSNLLKPSPRSKIVKLLPKVTVVEISLLLFSKLNTSKYSLPLVKVMVPKLVELVPITMAEP